MNTFRVALARSVMASRGPATRAVRNSMHQTKSGQDDDLTWLEGDRKMTPEERYALQKQRALLAKQAAEINAAYETEHQKTREAMEEHTSKSSQKIADLESKIDELKALLEGLKK
ncbi:hypothetical protein DIPPA_33307 [Diplonema papillatum]|nr:hypothetical protein DIPPA_33307 [Diplonema papillatum]